MSLSYESYWQTKRRLIGVDGWVQMPVVWSTQSETFQAKQGRLKPSNCSLMSSLLSRACSVGSERSLVSFQWGWFLSLEIGGENVTDTMMQLMCLGVNLLVTKWQYSLSGELRSRSPQSCFSSSCMTSKFWTFVGSVRNVNVVTLISMQTIQFERVVSGETLFHSLGLAR